MGIKRPSQQKKRLKPAWQGLIFHARQPALILLAGSVLALAINFSMGQVHLTQAPEDTALSENGQSNESLSTLDKFDLETDSNAKEVKVTLHRNDKSQPAFKVTPTQKGNQYTLLLDNTQLSQGMVENGLPVVIDNQNKLIGRAVPGKNVTQSKIIIPNMPSGEAYRVLVYEQTPGNAKRLISAPATATPSIAANNSQPYLTAQNEPVNHIEIAPRKAYASEIAQPVYRAPVTTNPQVTAPRIAHVEELPGLRLEKASASTSYAPPLTSKPKPRAAVSNMESEFDRIASRTIAALPPLQQLARNLTPANRIEPTDSPIAMASIASPKTQIAKAAKRPIQIIENKAVKDDEIPVAPKLGVKLPQNISPVTQGAVTYVPSFSGNGKKTLIKNAPLWNPYVVNEKNDSEETQSVNPPGLPPLQTASNPQTPPAQQDPLWYLHQLPNAAPPQTVSSLPLQAVPDLSNGLPAIPPTNGNPSLSPTPGATASQNTASGSIQIDSNLFKTVNHTLSNLPIWLYIVFGLFFGGIGLFATLGSVVLVFQLIQSIRKPVQPQIITVAAPAPVIETPTIEPPAQEVEPEPESIQFRDSATFNLSPYLHQSQALDQQQAVKQAVKKSVLLHFPSHRAGKAGQRKASHLL